MGTVKSPERRKGGNIIQQTIHEISDGQGVSSSGPDATVPTGSEMFVGRNQAEWAPTTKGM